MGHRRNRKRQRRGEPDRQDSAAWGPGPSIAFSDEVDDGDFAMLLDFQRRPLMAEVERACGGCSEFVEDGEGGRGTCLHPGSGILSPWTDTPGCDFFSGRRRR